MKGNLTEIWFRKQNHDKLVLDMQNKLNSTTNINLIFHEKVSYMHSIFHMIWAWANGHHWVCLQIDSLLAYKLLNTNEDYPMEFSNLILDCRWLLSRDWEVHVKHIWREANSCPDLLAQRGASQSEMEVLYDTYPTFLWQCLYWDSMGFVSSRSRHG